jgi:hypothetical protein
MFKMNKRINEWMPYGFVEESQNKEVDYDITEEELQEIVHELIEEKFDLSRIGNFFNKNKKAIGLGGAAVGGVVLARKKIAKFFKGITKGISEYIEAQAEANRRKMELVVESFPKQALAPYDEIMDSLQYVSAGNFSYKGNKYMDQIQMRIAQAKMKYKKTNKKDYYAIMEYYNWSEENLAEIQYAIKLMTGEIVEIEETEVIDETGAGATVTGATVSGKGSFRPSKIEAVSIINKNAMFIERALKEAWQLRDSDLTYNGIYYNQSENEYKLYFDDKAKNKAGVVKLDIEPNGDVGFAKPDVYNYQSSDKLIRTAKIWDKDLEFIGDFR